VDPSRVMPFQDEPGYLRDRVAETLGIAYDMPWPNREYTTARGIRRSPLHDRWASAGACFGQRAGWERPLWFARHGRPAVLSYSWDRPSWFLDWATEHRAARESVAVFDQTSFAKFEIRGPQACAALQALATADLDAPPGRVVYTALLNERGTFESDLTITRLAGDRYYVVTAAAQQAHDRELFRRGLLGWDAGIEDVTDAVRVLGLMGPGARDLLADLADDDLSTTGLPFLAARRMAVGPVSALVLRVSYVGELGFELHVPIDDLPGLWAYLEPAARNAGAVLAGYTAMNSLRLEKAFGAWGLDLSADDTPLEAAMSFVCDWQKPGGFRGREALDRQRSEGIRRRLVTFVLEDPAPLLWGGEVVVRDGRPAGHLSSGSYGHTLGAAVGMGYLAAGDGRPVDRAWLEAGDYQIDTGQGRFPASVHLRAPYDPSGARLRG
jgi:glycine cleavage system aminomethyltransferase T